MATVIKAGNNSTGAQVSSDNTGILTIATGTGAGTTAVTVDASQNVGVGTTSPTTILNIEKSAPSASVDLLVRNTGTDGTSNARIMSFVSSASGGDPKIGVGITGVQDYFWYIDNSDSDKLKLDSNGSDLLTVTSAGSVGIGTTSPAEKLDVVGVYVQAADTRANNTNKLFGLRMPHYANATTAVNLIGAVSTSGGNAVYIGGNDTSFAGTAATSIQFYTAATGSVASGTQRMIIDSAGNVGVGTASPLSTLEINRNTTSGTSTAYPNIRLDNQNAAGYTGYYFHQSGTQKAFFEVKNDVGALTMGTGSTERGRFTPQGYFKATSNGSYQNSTSSTHEFRTDSNDWTVWFQSVSSTAANCYGLRMQYPNAAPNATNSQFLYCQDSAALRAEIRSNGGLANFQANNVNLSDRREKTDFAPAKDYLDVICAIPVQTFNYIDQSEDDPGLTLGVVAQDVEAVAPELVMESNWGTPEEPKMRLSIYQTDLQYALMKSIQELKAIVDAQAAEIAVLKGAAQ